MKGSTLQLVTRHSSLVAALVLAALAANAGVKYWDNPDFRAFDVGDYVQDGLVVNYDGIRNAGPNAPHDSSAMTWVNCANPGTYDMARYSLVSSSWTADASSGSWTDYGFTFAKKSVFWETEPFTLPTKHSVQTLVDANSVDQSGIGYIFCGYNASAWQTSSIGIRSNGFSGSTNLYYFVCENGTGGRPTIPATLNTAPGANEHFYYATAILDVTNGVMFAGTTAPWTASGWKNGHAISKTKTPSATTIANGICLGGHYPRTDELFKGTLKSVRFYNRCLSDTEVAYNRMVDEARYFGRKVRAPIPVTNVVVSTTIPGVPADHFALDAEGYTFTAPAQRTVDGYRYVLDGYTLETWNGSAWGGSVSHAGEISYTASDSALVRLTWQYSHPAGEGRLAFYGVDDYVQDGLQIFLDGIRNAGSNAAHNFTATKWANLGTRGSAADATLSLGKDASAWTEDGFNFFGKSSFSVPFGFDRTANATMQILSDSVPSQQQIPSGKHQYIMSGSYNQFALSTYGNNFCFRSFGKDPTVSVGATNPVGYKTMIVTNGATKASIVFSGTTIPSSGNGYQLFDSLTSTTHNSVALGGWGGEKCQFTIGGVKFFRYYNRVLTEAELEHNRRVDNYRYFGIYEPENPNVTVQSTYSFLEGYDPCGDYEVEGSYTFAAPATMTAPNGIEYACDGYIVEKKSGQVGWVVVAESAGNAYAYSTSAGPIRLTWKWRATHGLRTAADYDFADYSQAGLRLHYDGLLNSGVDIARSTTATKWVNLGSAGSSMDLTLSRASSDNNRSTWGEQGYDFAGHAMFYSSATMWTTNNFTAQAFVDAAFADNAHASGNYIAATDWSKMGFQIWGASNCARLNALGQNYIDPRPRFTTANGRLQYVTAIQNDSAKTTTIFPGTSAPTSGTAETGFRQYTVCTNEYSIAFRLGGWGGGAGSDQCLVGTLNNFRYYDRVLTEEELVRNRQVDSVRYFGELGVTNLVVAIEEGVNFDATPAPGAYFVEGSYELTVAPGADTPTRYKLHDWDATNGEWINPRTVNGTTLNFNVAEATAATMKVTWCKTKAFMLIVR